MPQQYPSNNDTQSTRQLVLWDTDVTVSGDGRATLTAKRPLSTCGARKACSILGMAVDRESIQGSLWTLRRLARLGLVRAWKPGKVAVRKDGRRSNAKQVYCVESLLLWRAKVESG